ncbi:hypothetical protein NC653_003453 [Populus alba x Populus x berolinensis]|uniref:Uncharacterized protein n=1 Tax=Populus alba x Populus x berolinensis TaxID=444605 RepID=A0AAD6WKP8_9ROSI|nr:hypothetical protein NC653_003453 [Populus alba x Populus x berolinensis]
MSCPYSFMNRISDGVSRSKLSKAVPKLKS